MKANEFFRSMGLDAVKGFIENGNIRQPETELELKRLVESHELVESHGGLYQARKVAHKNCFEYPMRLLQAIADVESCQ